MDNARTERIDYFKIVHRGEQDEAILWKSRIENTVNFVLAGQAIPMKAVGTFNRHYDNATKTWYDTYESWGEYCEEIYTHLPISDRADVLRFDYRIAFDKPFIRLSTIEHISRARAKTLRRTVTRIDSPARTKSGDRDAGGDFLAVGAKGSRRRVALYKRGNEQWALEAQFGSGVPKQIYQEATDLYINTSPSGSFIDCLKKVLYHHHEEVTREFFNFSVDAILGEEDAQLQESLQSHQENLLETFDEFWEKADPLSKEVLRLKVLEKPENYATIRYEPVEPADLWAGMEHLEDR